MKAKRNVERYLFERWQNILKNVDDSVQIALDSQYPVVCLFVFRDGDNGRVGGLEDWWIGVEQRKDKSVIQSGKDCLRYSCLIDLYQFLSILLNVSLDRSMKISQMRS